MRTFLHFGMKLHILFIICLLAHEIIDWKDIKTVFTLREKIKSCYYRLGVTFWIVQTSDETKLASGVAFYGEVRCLIVTWGGWVGKTFCAKTTTCNDVLHSSWRKQVVSWHWWLENFKRYFSKHLTVAPFMGGGTSVGCLFSWGGTSVWGGFNFAPFLADGQWGFHLREGEKSKVSSSLNHPLHYTTWRLFQRQRSNKAVLSRNSNECRK